MAPEHCGEVAQLVSLCLVQTQRFLKPSTKRLSAVSDVCREPCDCAYIEISYKACKRDPICAAEKGKDSAQAGF
eukprot:6471329-Amphidinium_carterae.1